MWYGMLFVDRFGMEDNLCWGSREWGIRLDFRFRVGRVSVSGKIYVCVLGKIYFIDLWILMVKF